MLEDLIYFCLVQRYVYSSISKCKNVQLYGFYNFLELESLIKLTTPGFGDFILLKYDSMIDFCELDF